MEAGGTTTSTSPPVMRVAGGAFTEWAGTALNQCRWREEVATATCSGAAGNNSCYDDAPQAAAKGSTAGFTMRVQVCGNAKEW